MRWTALLLATYFPPLTIPTPIPPPSSSTNMTLIPPSPHHLPHPPNTPTHPLTFLGITCYHLLPTTVSLLTCQPLFASLVAAGHVHTPYPIWNGWVFQSGYEPCVIRIESPAPEDRWKKVSLSMSQVVLMATEVLEGCEREGGAGANAFGDGDWRLIVTRDGREGPRRKGRKMGEGREEGAG